MNDHGVLAHTLQGAGGATALAKDPICGMMVDKAKALTAERGGRTYYFCSPACKTAFEKSPEKYASK